MLYSFRVLSMDANKNLSALWGKLAAEILEKRWQEANEDLNLLMEYIDSESGFLVRASLVNGYPAQHSQFPGLSQASLALPPSSSCSRELGCCTGACSSFSSAQRWVNFLLSCSVRLPNTRLARGSSLCHLLLVCLPNHLFRARRNWWSCLSASQSTTMSSKPCARTCCATWPWWW